MAYAERTYSSASGTEFALTNSDGKQIFFIKEDDISVYVNGVEWTNANSGTSTYTISTDKTKVNLNSSVSGVTVLLQRITAIQDPTVTYTAGSTLTAIDLNNADNQIRYGLQEFSDKYAALITTTGNLPTAFSSFLAGADTWVSNDNRAATTLAIDNRVDSKIDTALTTDVSGGDGVTIVDNSPGSGQIRIDLDADIAALRNMQTGAASALAALTATELQILDGATVSTTQLNYVTGVSSAIQTQLDNKQASDATLTALAGVTSAADKIPYFTGSDAANVTDLTAFARTLLDDASATAARTTLSAQVQNDILDDLAGLTQATDKLPYFSSASAMATTDITTVARALLDDTSVSDQRATLGLTIGTNVQAFAQDLTNISSMQSGASTELATLTSSELDVLDGLTTANKTAIQSICTSGQTLETSLSTTDNTKIPTSKAVADYVNNQSAAFGGFFAINLPSGATGSDTDFSDLKGDGTNAGTQPDQGVVVSIGDVGSGFTVNNSGVITITNAAGTNKNVEISGFPSDLRTTIADDTGLQITSDKDNSTSGTPAVHKYKYHKLLAKESDVIQLSNDINDFLDRYLAASATDPAGSHSVGDLYFNTSSNDMKVYNSSNQWVVVQSVGSYEYLTIAQSANGSSASFNNSETRFKLVKVAGGAAVTPESAAQLIVSVNGVIQKPNTGTNPSGLEGFVVNGTDIIFTAAPATASPHHIVLIGSTVDVGTPSNNTVGLDELEHAAAGSILYWDTSTVPQRLAPDNGKFLRSNGSGSNPSWITVNDVTTTINTNADNRIITGSGTANTLNGEANLTFDGNNLAQTIDASGEGVKLTAAGDHWVAFVGDSNRTNDSVYCTSFSGKWNGTTIGSFNIITGADDTNKDEGELQFTTTPSGGSETERLRIDSSGNAKFSTNQVHLYNNIDTSNTYFYAQNTGGGNAGVKMKNSDGEWTIVANDRLRFMDDDAGEERLSITSTGNVGIGTTAPPDNLNVVGTIRVNQSTALDHATNAATLLEVRGDHIGDGGVDLDYFKGFKIALNDGTEWGGQAQFSVGRWEEASNNHARSSLMISLGHGASSSATDADTDVLLLKSDGSVTISDGDLVMGGTGHGINFAAAQTNAGGMTSETLNSYEEGTFTPKFGGVTNYSTYHVDGGGFYRKIGKMVYIVCRFNGVTLNASAAGVAMIYNLPFAPTMYGSPTAYPKSTEFGTHLVNFNSSYHYYWGCTTGYGGAWLGQYSVSDGNWADWSVGDFDASSWYMDFSGWYST